MIGSNVAKAFKEKPINWDALYSGDTPTSLPTAGRYRTSPIHIKQIGRYALAAFCLVRLHHPASLVLQPARATRLPFVYTDCAMHYLVHVRQAGRSSRRSLRSVRTFSSAVSSYSTYGPGRH